MRRRVAALGALALVAVAAACELTDVELVDFTEVVVAEAFVSITDVPGQNRLKAFIHGTAPGGQPSSQTFNDAVVTVTDDEGVSSRLMLDFVDECVSTRPDGSGGTCFVADANRAATFESGEALDIDIMLADGRRLTGSTRIPGDFVVDGVGPACLLLPDTRLPLRWSRSDSAWAYVNEASLTGLTAALAGEGIEAEDSLFLVGLSISANDTTVVFPNEFGIFDRFDLDQDVAVRLQRGLPEGVNAEVAITAVDRNFVNWVRGGSFNPSGTVRVSSLVGDGSGVFGGTVSRRFTVVSTTDTSTGSVCPVP
jgi:hypothetical protein